MTGINVAVSLKQLERNWRYQQLIKNDVVIDMDILGSSSISPKVKAVHYIGNSILGEVERTDECPMSLWNLYVDLLLQTERGQYSSGRNQQVSGDDNPDPLTGLCLVAISGDCSKYGMGGPNNVLPIKDEHEAIVREYLRATLEWYMDCSFNDQHDQDIFRNYDKASHALLNAGVFRHKYHMRTTWELAYLDEVEELERFHPYKIVEVEA